MRKAKEESSDSDEDPRMAHKKAQKKSSVNQGLQMEVAAKTITKNMFQQRGLEFNEEELKKMTSNSAATAPTNKKGGGFVAGGSHATFEELKKELSINLSKNDNKTACIVLKYILEKDIQIELKRGYILQRCQLLIVMKQYEDCVAECSKYISPISDSSNSKDFAQKRYNICLRLHLATAQSYLGQVWIGYLELLRAQADCEGLIQAKKEEAQGEGKNKNKQWQSEQDYVWSESENDLLLKELENTELHFKVILNQEKNKTASFIYTSGFSNTGCLGLESVEQTKLAILPQIRNRQVLSVACGDHHTVALVKAFPTSLLFNPSYGQISQSFDHSYEVFAWGENTCGQITGDSSINKIIDHPLLINYFSGKFINAVGAYKASSIAVDLNGNVYEWGANKFNKSEQNYIEKTFSLPQKEVINVVRGQRVYAVLDSKFQCYWWGELKVGEINKQAQQAKIKNITSISCGYNHIVITDSNGGVYGLGDNTKNQLAIKGIKFTYDFDKIKQFQNTKIIEAKAYQDATLFVTSEGELLYTGQISHTKNSEFAKEAEFPEQVNITSCGGYDGELFAISSSGETYIWEADSTIKFKLHKDVSQNTFREIAVGSGFQVLLKTLPIANLTKIRLLTETELQTYEEFEVEVQLRDQKGSWAIKPFYPLRYQLFVSENPKLQQFDLEQLAQNFSNMTLSKYQEEGIYIDEIGGAKLLTSSVKQNEQHPDIYVMNLSIEQSGVHYLYIMVNEQLANSTPLKLNIVASGQELNRKQELEQQQQKKLQDILSQKAKEEEKRKKEQEYLEQQRIQDEQLEQKKKDTDDRAREAYAKYLKDQQDKKSKDEEERKRKAELQTGGGFDLNKAKQLNKQPTQNMGSTQSNYKPSNSSMGYGQDPPQANQKYTQRVQTTATSGLRQPAGNPPGKQQLSQTKTTLGRPAAKKN